MNTKRAPKVRFKGFTDAWELRKFESIAARASSMSADPTLPRVEYEDIISGIGLLNKDVKLKGISKPGIVFNQGDVLYGKLRPYLHNWFLPSFSGLAVGDFWVLQPKDADSSFLFRLIQGQQFDDVANQSIGTKMPRADWNLVSKTLFFVPPSIDEQALIGRYFRSIDNLITLHQRKLDKTKKLKKAFLNLIFGQKLRFRGFTDSWELRKLEEISNKVIEKNKDCKYTETFTNSAELGIISQRDFFDKDISNNENMNGYYVVRNGDFVYNPRVSTSAPVGPIKRNNLGRTGIMSPLYYIFHTHDIVDGRYLEYYFSSTKWHKFMKQNGDSGVRSDRLAIKDTTFIKMIIPIPSKMKEQRKVGIFFKLLDDTIILRQEKINQLIKLKTIFLKNMFI
jgi:type I restriction enzyme S subunit